MNKKICIGAFIIAIAGFISYLVMMIVSFLSCCVGITDGTFGIIAISVVTLGAIGAGLCLYHNCRKIKNPPATEGGYV